MVAGLGIVASMELSFRFSFLCRVACLPILAINLACGVCLRTTVVCALIILGDAVKAAGIRALSHFER